MTLVFKPHDLHKLGLVFSFFLFVFSFLFGEVMPVVLTFLSFFVCTVIVFGLKKEIIIKNSCIYERLIIFNLCYAQNKFIFNHHSEFRLGYHNYEPGSDSIYLYFDKQSILLYGNRNDIIRKFKKLTNYINEIKKIK